MWPFGCPGQESGRGSDRAIPRFVSCLAEVLEAWDVPFMGLRYQETPAERSEALIDPDARSSTTHTEKTVHPTQNDDWC